MTATYAPTDGWVIKTVPFSLYKGVKNRKAIISAQTATVTSSGSNPAPGSVVTVSATNGYSLKTNLVADHVLQRLEFQIGSDRFIDVGGVLKKNINLSTGNGDAVGSVIGASGEAVLQSGFSGLSSSVSNFRGVQAPPSAGIRTPFMSATVMFRTAAAPIRPGTLSILGTMEDGVTFNVTAGVDGKVNSTRVKGRVNYETGLVELYFVNPGDSTPAAAIDLTSLGISGVGVLPVSLVRTSTLRYNVVSYSYLPLDAEVLGLDPVRLPQDGRVPVYKAGRVIVVHNTKTLAPQTVANNQLVPCGRTNLSRIRVFDSSGVSVTSGFTVNLDTGVVLFANVAGLAQPVTIEHRIEDESLCAEAQITGDLRLTRAITHSYPVEDTYVSSAMIVKTLQAATNDAFSQLAWTDVWSDIRIGPVILANYNQVTYPIEVTNAGAVTERWAIIFTSSTAFRVVGESVGQIITGNTSADLSPVNPATGVPYFIIREGGWGSGWSAGNVLRFNTKGANFPMWMARTVLQSQAAAPGTDQFTIELRGDVDV